MSYYNNNRYTPGNKANLRKYLQNQSIIHSYVNYITFINSQNTLNILNANDITDYSCVCQPLSKVNNLKQGYNDPSISEAVRISQRIQQSNLGGKITFGNMNKPVQINYLGGWEGQPGGSFKSISNKF